MQSIKPYCFLTLTGMALGATVALLFPDSWFWGWVSTSLLLTISLSLLYLAWRKMGKNRLMAWMIALAFGLRVITGVGLSLALPVFGYAEPCQKAGYLFKDACHRDHESYAVAHSTNSLFYGSGIRLDSDQYGGLVYLSAWIYRYLSPDVHRPYLVLIVGAFFAAIGIAFFYSGLMERWTGRTANVAAWIYVLYPDAVFFGSSQMREPFLVGLSAIAFWAVMTWQGHWKRRLPVFVMAILVMAFFSPRIAAVESAALAIWVWIDWVFACSGRRSRVLGWLGFLAGGVLLFAVSWTWMQASSGWDVLVTIRGSGWIQKIIRESGDDRLIYPIIVVYGLAQPVLPAAIADVNALPLWRVIGIIRSAGWYLLAPFLVYGLLAFKAERDPRRRRLLIWLGCVTVAWLLIAAVRGGGDMTDNPRYRSLFIPWLALLGGWSMDTAFTLRSWVMDWLLAVEGVFLACFLNWYSARYLHVGIQLPFGQIITIILVLSGALFTGVLTSRCLRMWGEKTIAPKAQRKRANAPRRLA